MTEIPTAVPLLPLNVSGQEDGPMANPEHLALLKSGRTEWNRWREEQPGGESAVLPDLSGANLSGLDLNGMNFFRANLAGAVLYDSELTDTDFMRADLKGAWISGTLRRARFYAADLTGASFCFLSILERANFSEAVLRRVSLNNVHAANSSFVGSDLIDAHLRNADLTGADFTNAKLTGADLTGANLTLARLVKTDLTRAVLVGPRVYGISAWDVHTEAAKQTGLVITQEGKPEIAVDDLEVAQFIYLLLNNRKVRNVIHTITSKAVLILGRFTDARKPVLEALHVALREKYGLVPILFDWEPSDNRDLTETVLLQAINRPYEFDGKSDGKNLAWHGFK